MGGDTERKRGMSQGCELPVLSLGVIWTRQAREEMPKKKKILVKVMWSILLTLQLYINDQMGPTPPLIISGAKLWFDFQIGFVLPLCLWPVPVLYIFLLLYQFSHLWDTMFYHICREAHPRRTPTPQVETCYFVLGGSIACMAQFMQ